MVDIIQTVLICATVLVVTWKVCPLFKREPAPAPEAHVDYQAILDKEYENNKNIAYGVAREIQSIFLDEDQIGGVNDGVR